MHLALAMSAKAVAILQVAVNLRQKSLSQKLRFSKIKEMVSTHWVGTISLISPISLISQA